MAGMYDLTPGLNALSGGLSSIGNVFQAYQQQRLLDQRKQEMIDLGQQIQSGDLKGAAARAIGLGDLNTGLKLYQLHQQNSDEAGLGEKLSRIRSGAGPSVGPQSSADTPVSPMASITQSGTVPGFPDASAYAIGAGEGGVGANRYSKLGVVIPKTGDRAYGAYQVMGANIGPWTKEILGQEMTPQEFLASPAAQDAVFKGKFGQYQQQYGPQGAAAMWFSGSPNVNSQARDPLGTSVSGYVNGFSRRLGQPPPGTGLGAAPAAQAITDAMGGVTSPDGTSIVPPARSAVADAATEPLPITLAASTTQAPSPSGPRPLGPPPDAEEDPQVVAKLKARDELIGLMHQAKGTKWEGEITSSINSLNNEITYLRNRKDVTTKAQDNYRLGKSLGYEGEDLKYFTSTGHPPSPTETAPIVHEVTNPDGTKTTMAYDRRAKTWSPLTAPPQPRDPNVPEGLDPKELAKKQSDAYVKGLQLQRESEATKETAMPFLDRAIEAYQKLKGAKALGPLVGSAPNQWVTNAMGSDIGRAQTAYNQAINNLRLLSNPFKGQGAVSDFERHLMNAQYPELSNSFGEEGLKTLMEHKNKLENASHKIYIPGVSGKAATQPSEDGVITLENGIKVKRLN